MWPGAGRHVSSASGSTTIRRRGLDSMDGNDWLLLLLTVGLLMLTLALVRLPLKGERREDDSR